MARSQGIKPYPVVTLTISLLALVATFWPAAATALRYDRQALLAGELWRLLGAPLVHFSAGHLFWNLLVFTPAGWVIETAGDRSFAPMCGLAAVISGGFYLLAAPDLTFYGGLSGLATAAVCYLALRQATAGSGGHLWWCILVLVGLKIAVETIAGQPLFVRGDSLTFRMLPSAHLLGAAVAVGCRLRLLLTARIAMTE